MKELDARFNYECNLEMQARWEYVVDVTDPDKEQAANAAAVRYLDFKGQAAVNASQFDYGGFDSIQLYRRFRFISKQGPGALSPADLTEYKTLQARMETIYSTATICDFYEPTKCDLALEPDIEAILAYSRNWDELRHVWDQWRDVTGKLMRDDFIRFAELSNQAAVLDGFDDTGMYWLNGYTVDDREATSFVAANPLDQTQFRQMLDTVWDTVSDGLYKKLHAYVRYRLNDVYSGQIDLEGPIPANILGNMWAQDWVNIADLVMPFPQFPSYDVSDSMVKNGWDIQQMFDSAEDFFKSLDLFPMTQSFWDKSVINQTAWGKVIVCHASAEDFCLGPDGDDWRIKMCTDVNMPDLITVHHEMGHIEYFMAYKNQPHVFRDSANAGFHEAIGDLIALSVSTPSHLENILHLSPEVPTTTPPKKNTKYTDDEMKDLNFLMRMALEKISFLPFGYLIDKFRWGVFDGSIPTDQMNAGWWQLRQDLQGVAPPGAPRGEEFFDPGAKYHVPANVPYIRYFVSFIVQFQFHSHLCQIAGYSGPLHLCDIYNNTAAGIVLRDALERGFSEPWPIVLESLGGSLDMDPQAIISYFEPLITFLDEELANAGQCVGWGDDCLPYDYVDEEFLDDDELAAASADTTVASPTTEESTSPVDTTLAPGSEAQAEIDMKNMDERVTTAVNNAVLKDWTYALDMTEANRNISIEAWINANDIFNTNYHEIFPKYDYESFQSQDLKRQFQLQENRGTAVLSNEDLNQLNFIIAEMGATLSSARVCPVDNKDCDEKDALDLFQLENIMATTTNYKDLQYYWREWRDVTGEIVIDHYKDYITLENRAAEGNGFNHTAHMWLDAYTDGGYTVNNFMSEIEILWNETKPLYRNLHAYVRHKLQKKYSDFDNDNDLIPAHILGDMYGQNWENLYEILKPHEDVEIVDITDTLNKSSTVKEMSRLAQQYFEDIGLRRMTPDFKENSILERPSDKNVTTCQPAAWDFFDVYTPTSNPQTQGRFRIKKCAGKTQRDFISMHHLIGHTQYQMAYSARDLLPDPEKMPLVFRDGANPGFHEAVGGAMSLYASTPSYLLDIKNSIAPTGSKLATMVDPLEEPKADINFLMKMALSKIAFIPYAYILDAWRWELFEKNNTVKDFNRLWWKLRIEEQGIAPPEERYPESHFDAASKFQIHNKLCDIDGNTDAIYNCTLNNPTSTEALRDMMALGRSKGWQDILKEFLGTGQGKMSAESIKDYFEPLNIFLEDYLSANKIAAGWKSDQLDKYIKAEREEISAAVPIIVGCVLAGMVCVVIVAYFVGNSRQKKKAKAKKAQESKQGVDNIEMGEKKDENEKL
ncbi:hypothetical protein SK128_003261 [Halocaridina rubra]|uniref:Angiotensin-converting enzyme n=1 Tax=Halocaridina rubra TaxID=373956 RepID=A0AAN9FUB1_HALRR